MHRNVFIVATVLGVVLSGCGGGDSSPAPSPTSSRFVDPTPRPFASPLSGVTATTVRGGDGKTRVNIRWEPAPDIPASNIVEYHIYRDDRIIGMATSATRLFVDSDERNGTTFSYNVADGVSSALQTGTATVEPFTAVLPSLYTVRVVYRKTNGFFEEYRLGNALSSPFL